MSFCRLVVVFIILFSFSLCSGQELPKEKLYQFSYTRNINYENDTIKITIQNPLLCPLRVYLFSQYLKEQHLITDTIRLTLKGKSNKEYKIFAKNIDHQKINFRINEAFGDENKKIIKNNLSLPFIKGKKYRIMQEQQGNYSHNDSYSKYAIDFTMPVGDTIVSADDGYVVGVIKDFQYGKDDIKWTPYANFITIYHPHSGLFTQYAHLKQNGCFVIVGDAVKRDQQIGLSGETGYVSGAHLHFNVLVPEKEKSLISIPYSFEKVNAKDLKKNNYVKK